MPEGMFNADAIEKTGEGIPDETSELGEIADARTPTEEGGGEQGATGEKTQAEIDAEAAATSTEAEAVKTAEDIAAEEAAKNAGKTDAEIAAEKEAADADVEKARKEAARAEAKAELLKELGLSSEDELKEKLKGPAKDETPEEKAAREEQYTAGLLGFSTKEKLFNADDYSTLQGLKKSTPVDLAYADFVAEYKEVNKDRKGEDGAADPITDEEAREAFNQAYHINSEDAHLKQVGEKQIKALAEAKVKDLESKFSDAKEAYDEKVFKDAKSKPFFSFVNQTVKDAIPASIDFEGENGVKVTYPITNADVKEIEKIFITDRSFDDFIKNGASAESKDYIKKTVDAYLWHKNKDEILKTVSTTAYSSGLKAGSAGSSVPFTKETQQQVVGGTDRELTTAEKAKLKESMGTPYGR